MLIDGYTSAAAGGAPKDEALFWWQGFSSRYYLTSIFRLAKLDCREAGVFLMVRREADNTRTPLLIGAAKSISDDLPDLYGDAFLRAISAGANEIHVNFTATSDVRRQKMIADIVEGWSVPVVGASEGVLHYA